MSGDVRCWKVSMALLAAVGVVCLCGALHAAEKATAAKQSGRRQAILIGMGEYQKVTPLRFTANDVRQLALTLRERGDYDVLEIVDTANPAEGQSESEAMQAKVRECLEKLTAKDDVLVYFSGHGFRDKQENLFLAQINFDPTAPERGGVPVTWLREQLAGCKAKFKLLIIDACHGGSEKGDDATPSVTAKELGMPFQDLTSVVTLASSQAGEKSLVWNEKRQSLFTYWLNQGLKGHADPNNDGAVTIDELYGFVFRNVTDVAKQHFQLTQTPVRIVRSGTPGVPVVISLNPQTLKGIISDMAEQLATAIQMRGLKKVGVPEFTVDMGPREMLGGQFGTLGRYCAVELERGLLESSVGKFDVIQHDALQEVLQTKGYAVKDLSKASADDLKVNDTPTPALALGTLRSRTGRVMTLQCKLVDLDGQANFGAAGGAASLNESEWGMLGRSVRVPPPEGATVDAPEPPDVFQRMDRDSQKTHPMLDPNFPHPVRIMVGNQERKGVFRGNDLFVPLKKGEVYCIHIENRTSAKVLMRLLVDGRNTLPEEVKSKGVHVEKRKPEPRFEAAQTVNLAEARHWHLEPNKAYSVAGFYSKLGADGTYREFTVADAPDSLTARERFGEDLGLITAAFYAPKGTARGPAGLMTELGEERKQKLRMYAATEVGELLAVVHIRYVEPDVLTAAAEGGINPSSR